MEILNLMRRSTPIALLVSLLLAATAFGQVSPSVFANFEGAQTNPVRMSADGTLLFAVDTPDARLSVFSLSNPSAPVLTAEIPVGIEPVSVNPRTNSEVWVVNQESDSISIVNVTKKIVTATIYVKDEPSDVVLPEAMHSSARRGTTRFRCSMPPATRW